MTNREIFESKNAWSGMLQQKLNIKTSFKLMKYVKLVEAEIALINEQKDRLVKEKYGVKGEDEKNFMIPQDKIQDFANELNELLLEESDLPQIDITMEKFIDAISNESNTIKTIDILLLEPFFKKEIEKKDIDEVIN